MSIADTPHPALIGGTNTEQTLVILPGLDGTDVFFRPFLALLPASIRPLVICYPDGDNSYLRLLETVRSAVADIPAFYVLGSSFAGPLAIMLAAAEPHKVRGVILSATFLRCPRPHLTRFRWAAVAPVIWLLRAMRRIPVWTLRDRDDPFRRAKAETWSRVSARPLAARLRAILRVDTRQALSDCPAPFTCIVFSHDTVVPRSSSAEILHQRPATDLVALPGAHFGMYTDPVPFARTIIRFIHRGEITPSNAS